METTKLRDVLPIAVPSKRDRPAISLFIALTAAFSAPFYVLHAYSTTPGAGAYIRWLMWCPGIAALATLWMTEGRVTSIGWRWPSARTVIWSCGIPIIYIVATYTLGTLAGGGDFPNARFVTTTRASFAWRGLPTWAVIAAYLAVNGPASIVMNTATTLGEEVGWRGFLAPALSKRYGFAATSLISGSIWGLWHFPLIFVNQPFDWSNVYGAGCLLGGLTGVSFAMTWLRLRSGSVWSAALFHSAHNACNAMATSLMVSNANTPRLMDETGIVIVIVGGCGAVAFCVINARYPYNAATVIP